jgi:N-acetylglucosamine-6-phosphate deacetylase
MGTTHPAALVRRTASLAHGAIADVVVLDDAITVTTALRGESPVEL